MLDNQIELRDYIITFRAIPFHSIQSSSSIGPSTAGKRTK